MCVRRETRFHGDLKPSLAIGCNGFAKITISGTEMLRWILSCRTFLYLILLSAYTLHKKVKDILKIFRYFVLFEILELALILVF